MFELLLFSYFILHSHIHIFWDKVKNVTYYVTQKEFIIVTLLQGGEEL